MPEHIWCTMINLIITRRVMLTGTQKEWWGMRPKVRNKALSANKAKNVFAQPHIRNHSYVRARFVLDFAQHSAFPGSEAGPGFLFPGERNHLRTDFSVHVAILKYGSWAGDCLSPVGLNPLCYPLTHTECVKCVFTYIYAYIYIYVLPMSIYVPQFARLPKTFAW